MKNGDILGSKVSSIRSVSDSGSIGERRMLGGHKLRNADVGRFSLRFNVCKYWFETEGVRTQKNLRFPLTK